MTGRSATSEKIRDALARDRTIDITTTGRTSGQPRRLETWFHRLDNRYYMTGTPGRRDWYANLVANPEFTFHLKETATANLPARATPITDREARRAILSRITATVGESHRLEEWIERSPLVEVSFEHQTASDGDR